MVQERIGKAGRNNMLPAHFNNSETTGTILPEVPIQQKPAYNIFLSAAEISVSAAIFIRFLEESGIKTEVLITFETARHEVLC